LGWSKINVDGSFVAETGAGGIGVVARDSDDKILMTAWSTLFQCEDAAEVEARACEEGLRLAGQWITGPESLSRIVLVLLKLCRDWWIILTSVSSLLNQRIMVSFRLIAK
jgi:hypothetical protein